MAEQVGVRGWRGRAAGRMVDDAEVSQWGTRQLSQHLAQLSLNAGH